MPLARANRARFARLPLANQVLRIPIAGYKTQLSLEIGIDRFGVKKHVTS